jgi:hypothetical protein
MTLWGKALCVLVCLLFQEATALDPVPVCQATVNRKEFEGKAMALLGRYSFREGGPKKGRWLDQEGCGVIRLVLDAKNAPKPAEPVAFLEPALENKLATIRQHTTLAKFRFGSPDYDRWAVVIGRLEGSTGQELQLVYRGDGAVFFLAEK